MSSIRAFAKRGGRLSAAVLVAALAAAGIYALTRGRRDRRSRCPTRSSSSRRSPATSPRRTSCRSAARRSRSTSTGRRCSACSSPTSTCRSASSRSTSCRASRSSRTSSSRATRWPSRSTAPRRRSTSTRASSCATPPTRCGRSSRSTTASRRPPGARMPQMLSAKLVGPITGGFVDPLQAKIDSPGYSGPLKLKISALTHDLDAKFALDFDALPEAIFISEDPREDGLDVLYEHNAPVADVHLDATASLRNLTNNELLEVDAEIERLPQRIALSNTNTPTTTDVAYESSSTISNPDVSARYRDLDGERRRRHRREARHRRPAAEDGRDDHVGPQRRGRLGPRRRRLPRRRGPADRLGRLRGAQLRRAVAGARADPEPRAAHRVREPLRRRRDPLARRRPPAGHPLGEVRAPGPKNDIVDATHEPRRRRPPAARARRHRQPRRPGGRRRGRPAHRDRHDARAAARADPCDLQAVGRRRRSAAAVLRDVAQHGRRRDGGHRDGSGQTAAARPR